MCASHCSIYRRDAADPLFATFGHTGTSEVLISQHLPFVGAFCTGALEQAAGPATRTEGGEEAVRLSPQDLPPDQADHLLAAAMNFVNVCPALADPGIDAQAAGRAWWIAHRTPGDLTGLDQAAREALPLELLSYIAEFAHYPSGLFVRVERLGAQGARGIYRHSSPERAARRA
ncbi:hypothetical protein ACIQF6_35775 [Kitasatospora sp. NPDC092948]|uniref:hypothetical protein n=1 Tax=Kitasatospora sp. NPDC092948 TaxID=3364088 RepID=UPI0037FCDDA9